MGMYNLEDNMRAISGKEPWEPIWDPPPQPEPPKGDWRWFKIALTGFLLLLGAALYLATH